MRFPKFKKKYIHYLKNSINRRLFYKVIHKLLKFNEYEFVGFKINNLVNK